MGLFASTLEVPALIAAQLKNGSQQDSVVVAKGDVAYVINSERTMLVRIGLGSMVGVEVAWRSEDWEDGARSVTTHDGVTEFLVVQSNVEKRKTCPAPGVTFAEVDTAWKRETAAGPEFTLVGSMIKSNLDDSLSHIEFWNIGGKLVIKQRDLYGGSVIELRMKVMANDGVVPNFDRVALRTKDFLGLLMVDGTGDRPTFQFGKQATFVTGKTFRAVLGNCVYDDMYTVKELQDGRQEQEKRSGEQGTDPEVKGPTATGEQCPPKGFEL